MMSYNNNSNNNYDHEYYYYHYNDDNNDDNDEIPTSYSCGYDIYNDQTLPMFKEALHSGIANASSVQPIERLGTDSSGDVWIRSFLINSSVNSNGWSVDPDTLPNNVLSIIGKPLVIDRSRTGVPDHPEWDSRKSASGSS